MDSQKLLPFQAVDEFDQELYRKPISSDGRRFLQIMYQAANGVPPADVEGALIRQTQLQLIAEQLVLADLLGVPADLKKESRQKAVRRIVGELESLGILKRCSFVDDGKSVRYYVACIVRIIDLPDVDLSTTKGRAVAHALANDPFELSTENQPPSGGSSGGSSGGLSGLSKNPALAPVSCSCPSESINPPVPDQDRNRDGVNLIFELQDGPRRSFNEIEPDHVRAIAGFSPGGRQISDAVRLELFFEYLRDTIDIGFADVDEAELLLSVFAVAGRRMSAGIEPAKLRIRDPKMWIRSVWKARHTNAPKITTEAAKHARRLLAISKPASDSSERVEPNEPSEQTIAIDRIVAEIGQMNDDERRTFADRIPPGTMGHRCAEDPRWFENTAKVRFVAFEIAKAESLTLAGS